MTTRATCWERSRRLTPHVFEEFLARQSSVGEEALEDEALVFRHGIFLSGGEALFAAFLWVPAASFVVALVWAVRARMSRPSRVHRITAAISLVYTALAPLVLGSLGFLVGFWLRLCSLTLLTIALAFAEPSGPQAGTV